MSDPTKSLPQNLSPASASRQPGAGLGIGSKSHQSRSHVGASPEVEKACTEFEAAWLSGAALRIEELLARPAAADRDRLLDGLLEIELDLRQQAGDTPRLDEYRERFPEDAARVEAVFRRVVKQRRLGDYELLDELGRGGMGVVYRARQVHLNQIVALKVLPENYLDEPQVVARFRREMQSIGGLSHENIVRAYNAGEAGGVQFLVMEFVDGVNLQRLMTDRLDRRQGPLGIGAACEIIRQAALGLQHAHEHGLVHRDIKPANLMISRTGVVKLLDLGLAKFDADYRPVDQRTGPLTKAGATMGTVDYMAPEQWEDSSGVDIRADIYSLGCTLFFLLTGGPPYGDDSYDSSRKKLMAHVVAPVPSLCEKRPDCPEDLDQVLVYMMGKEPEDRFATPGELAEIMEAFADPDELNELAAAAMADLAAGRPTPEVTGAGDDTVPKHDRPSSKRLRFSGVRKRQPVWHQRTGVRAAAAFAAALAIGLGSWALFGPRPPANGYVANGSVQATGLLVDSRQIRADLALLPGLNGQWWFDEMPWLAPCTRRAVVQGLTEADDPRAVLGDRPTGYRDTNVLEVQKWLLAVVGRCRGSLTPRQEKVLDQLTAAASESINDAELEVRLAGLLSEFAGDDGDSPRTAEDLHTRAVLQHKLALLENRKDRAREALASYRQAADLYGKSEGPEAQLRLLCLSDCGRLCSEVLGDFDLARQQFEEAVASRDAPVLFAAETLAAYGQAAQIAGKYEDGNFVSALRLLADSEAGRRNHPLVAHVSERYAWSLIDQWKVAEAYKQFEAAYNIRWGNRRESKNPFATIYVLHNQHGMAMTQRYRGNLEAARQKYDEVLKDVKEALDEAGSQEARPGQQRCRRDLRERWSNSMERRADCELYQGAASDAASVQLDRAARLYQQASDEAGDVGSRAAMGCKLAIVLALAGDADGLKKARDLFARDEVGRQEVIGAGQERVGLLRQLAEAVLVLKEQGTDAGHKALRTFLHQFDLDPNYQGRHRRETQELQLLAAELLISSEWKSPQTRAAAQADLAYLDKLLAAFPAREQMLPYLRRYYDLAVQAAGDRDADRAASYVLASRNQRRPKGVALVLFHLRAKEGLAIVLPPDASGTLSALGFGRADVKHPAPGQVFRVPQAVVGFVERERTAGRPVEISWSDTMCFASEDEGLSAGDWPFGDQLGLRPPK